MSPGAPNKESMMKAIWLNFTMLFAYLGVTNGML